MQLKKELIYIYTLVIIVTFGYHMIANFLPIYMDSIGITLLNIGIIYAFAAIIAGILRFPVGAISDSFGRRPLLLAGAFGYPAFAVLISLAQNAFHFVSIQVVFHIFSMFFWVGVGAYLFDVLSKKHEGRQIAGQNIASTLSAAIAPITAGVIITLTGFTNLFYISAAITACAIPLVLWFERKEPAKQRKKVKINWEYLQKEYGDVVSSKGFKITAFICVLTNFIWAFWYLLFPLYLKELGFSMVIIGAVLTINLFLATAFYIILGRWIDSVSGRLMIIPGFFLMWLSGYAILWVRGVIGYTISRIGFGTGTDMAWQPAYASLARHTPKKEHGGALGLFGALTTFAYAFGSLFAGWVSDIYSIKFALLASSTLAFIVGIILILLSKHIIRADWLYSYKKTRYRKHHVIHSHLHN